MSTSTIKPKAMIQDNTRCIGCRACMVACKSWNDQPEDKTDFFAGEGYQNPRDLDANNYNLITFNEIVTGAKPDWVFGRQLCMHCEHPACASACPTTALNKTAIGAVVFDEDRCIGCRAAQGGVDSSLSKGGSSENETNQYHVSVDPLHTFTSVSLFFWFVQFPTS